MKYRNKLIAPISAIFVVFALISIGVGVMSEDNYKRAILKSRLEGYADIVARSDSLSQIVTYLPEDVRVTVISSNGVVLFDTVEEAANMPNHILRPEVKKCLEKGEGQAIRKSETSSRKYFYFAKNYGDKIVRTAQDTEINLSQFSRTDYVLILLIFLLLVVALLLLQHLSERYERKENENVEKERKRLKHEMTGNISHELKTPVSSIQSYLETLVNRPDLDDNHRRLFTQRAYLQSVRLADMISDISIITKLEEAPEQFSISPVNVKVVFEEVLEEMSERIKTGNISIKNNLPPVCISGSYHLIFSIFRNLVENTVKYAGEGSSALIEYTSHKKDEHTFEYRDNGRGVPESELEKIFGRFYRLDSDRSRAEGGSGLGLSIVRNAVLFHGGTVEAYTVEGGGLGLRFTLHDLK